MTDMLQVVFCHKMVSVPFCRSLWTPDDSMHIQDTLVFTYDVKLLPLKKGAFINTAFCWSLQNAVLMKSVTELSFHTISSNENCTLLQLCTACECSEVLPNSNTYFELHSFNNSRKQTQITITWSSEDGTSHSQPINLSTFKIK